MRWKGPIGVFVKDPTPEIDLEGGLSSGKTTACLWKEFYTLQHQPGIHVWIGRYGDGETQTKVRPTFEQICQQAGGVPTWNAKELCYDFPNGSKCFSYGLKSPDALSRYSKLRGLGVSRIYLDQTEELPEDFSGELRLRLRQPGFPHQLTFSPNPPNVTHWLAHQFPDDNSLPNRKYYSISIHDNAHNLPKELLEAALAAYPPDHAKYRSVILGKRGVNVTGVPVYKGLFTRAVHVGSTTFDPRMPLLVGLDFGKHHPCVVFGQQRHYGGWRLLGGLLGQDLFLDDFLPLVQTYLTTWFPTVPMGVQLACDPAGSHQNSQGTRFNGVDIVKRHGWHPLWQDNANAPDVRAGCIEALGAHLRRRTPEGEAFQLESDPARWLLISLQGPKAEPFLADALEAGYVWDEHLVSVGNKPIRKPKKDGWFEHGMNCFSADTDVLTDDGWCPFPLVPDGAPLATVNLETDTLEFQRPSRSVVQPFAGELVHFGGALDAATTPDHRMVVYPWTGDWATRVPTIKAAQDVLKSDRVKLVAGRWAGTVHEAMEVESAGLARRVEVDPYDWAEFLGWYVAEGSCNACVRMPGHGYSVAVSQRPGPKRDLLEALLRRLPWRWYGHGDGLQASSKQLWMALKPLGDKYSKRVPTWIRHAETEVIRRFLIGAVLGDGTYNRSGAAAYFSVSPRLADDVQELFLKLGRATSQRVVAGKPYTIAGRSGTNTRPQYHVWTRASSTAVMRSGDGSPHVRPMPYEGLVYCATVPNGTLVVRRHGRPYVAGNCLEYLELNFGATRLTGDQQARRKRERVADPGRMPTGATGWMGLWFFLVALLGAWHVGG
jgi:hypothetical protein